jgi:hypothetical protein
LIFSILLLACGPAPFRSLVGENWDRPDEWKADGDGRASIALSTIPGRAGDALRVAYDLGGGGWVQMRREVAGTVRAGTPITFLLRGPGPGTLEIKYVDVDGSTFGRRIPLGDEYKDWTQVVMDLDDIEYWWGGRDDELGDVKEFYFAVSGNGAGTVDLDEIGFGPAGTASTLPPVGPQLDPNRNLEGVSFEARRAAALIPEDTGVLEWLKAVQDHLSPGKDVLPSQECNELQTFNNALVAMAFMVKGERERAERILDFYAKRTVRRNANPRLQNFFLNGEARGFFQHVRLKEEGGVPALHTTNSDRWMGDMAWLLVAYKHHEKLYGGRKYREITRLLRDLLVSWYTDAPDGAGGYVQHGWRNGDQKLHEDHGHPEGNIDCMAVFRLTGDHALAGKIKIWLDRTVKGKSLPLDLYTWRVLAEGRDAAPLLDIPDFDLRYRKTLMVDGARVAGFFHGPDPAANNIWLDGTGHIACAYLLYGDPLRGNFYANQLDAFIIPREIEGRMTAAIPYTANKSVGYEWVQPDRGFVSVAAWYIFAKNRFNPLRLETGE